MKRYLSSTKDLEVMESKTYDGLLEMAKHRKEVEFMSIAAHEMKVPLQTILNSSEMLKKNPAGGHKYAPSIIRNATRLQTIAKNLLDLSRIENHSVTLNKEIFNLTDLISNTVDDVVPSIAKNYQNLHVTKPTTNIFVYADKDRIAQVLCNLLANAVKFTTDGTISISVEKRLRQKQILITIKDSGLGINPDILPSLFSKFVSTSPQGLGLGLYLAKNIIETHGGQITAKNNPDGKGASFAFTLPSIANDLL